MDTKELLQLAAKAAGIEIEEWQGPYPQVNGGNWHPLSDDGDALRLAVALSLFIDTNCGIKPTAFARSHFHAADSLEQHDGDPYAATRRAIVRAAAEIGKGMES